MQDFAYTRLILAHEFTHSELCSLLMEWECRRRGAAMDRAAPLLFMASHQGKAVSFLRSVGPGVSTPAEHVTQHKHATKRILAAAGLRVPAGLHLAASQRREAEEFAAAHGFEVVIKPLGKAGGTGVVAEIAGREDFLRSWAWLAGTRFAERGIIVEQRVPGNDYRLFVVAGTVVAALQRMPAEITGDGTSSIATLVAMKNRQRALNPDLRARPCVVDAVVHRNLSRHGLSPQSVLEAGRRFRLRHSANLSKGGESVDVTELVHPGFREIAAKAVAAIPGGLLHSSVDILAGAIDRPPGETGYAINELEGNPGMGLHHFPSRGSPRNVAAAIVDVYFPGTSARDPAPDAEAGLDGEASLEALQASIRCLRDSRRPMTARGGRHGAGHGGLPGDSAAPPDATAESAWRVLVEGKVVGVGFRRWIQRQAAGRSLDGWVRNRLGRRVEILVSGPAGDVDQLLALCWKGPRGARVTKVTATRATRPARRGFQRRRTVGPGGLPLVPERAVPAVHALRSWLLRLRRGASSPG